MSEQGLWPQDLEEVKRSTESTPKDILEAQAEDLSGKTHGKLVGRIEVGSQGDRITLDFLIVAPALDDFEYRLLKVRHRVLPVYPAEIILGTDDQRSVKSAKEFRLQLQDILSSKPTRSVVAELLSLIIDRQNKESKPKTKRAAK